MNCLIVLLFLTLISISECSVIINNYENNDCSSFVNVSLVNEIKGYQNVVKHIIDYVKHESGEEMYKNYSHFIDKFGARLSGSETLEKAIDSMLHLTEQNGIDRFFSEEVDVPHWVRGLEKATLISPRKKRIPILGLGHSVPTPTEGITAEVIVVKSFDELDQLPYNSVAGKILVFNPTYISYGETVKYRTQGATKAAIKGAVASLIRSVTPYSIYTLHTGSQSYGKNVTQIPTASITVEDANFLQRIFEIGQKLVIDMKMESSFEMKKSRNVLIDLEGRDYPDKLVLVSGHIDSWDVGEGAMDDGGGMFISWFTPIVLNRLGLKSKRTIRAALWTAEEPGLLGSATYLKRHINELNKINFVLESDEGTFAPLGLDVGGTRAARCIIAEILKLFSPIHVLGESKFPGSDLSQFVAMGIPGASLLNRNERYYYYHHTEADTLDVQNMTDVVNCAAFYTAVSYIIADLSIDIPRY